jgi:hypothetical protein
MEHVESVGAAERSGSLQRKLIMRFLLCRTKALLPRDQLSV